MSKQRSKQDNYQNSAAAKDATRLRKTLSRALKAGLRWQRAARLWEREWRRMDKHHQSYKKGAEGLLGEFRGRVAKLRKYGDDSKVDLEIAEADRTYLKTTLKNYGAEIRKLKVNEYKLRCQLTKWEDNDV